MNPRYEIDIDSQIERYQMKLKMWEDRYDIMQQAYHNLAQIINHDRHKANNWKDCQEKTCLMAVESISKIKAI
jgi:hypothetical protein